MADSDFLAVAAAPWCPETFTVNLSKMPNAALEPIDLMQWFASPPIQAMVASCEAVSVHMRICAYYVLHFQLLHLEVRFGFQNAHMRI